MINEKLKLPAIGLVAVGILNILCGLYFLFSAIVVAYSGVNYQNFTSEQEKLLFNVGFYGVIVWGIVSLIAAPFIISGALKMMRGEVSGKSKISAILAMLSVSFIIGLPVGAWALLTLKNARETENP